jgi:hypothetical protein
LNPLIKGRKKRGAMSVKSWKRRAAGLGLILTTILSFQAARAQQPGKPRDPAPFGRPQSLMTFTSADPRRTLADLVEIMRRHRFDVSDLNVEKGELRAVRKDRETSEDSDQLLLWIERDLANPTSRVSVYFLYARFEKFFGTPEGPVRVKIDQQFEQTRIGALKNDLVQYARVAVCDFRKGG